MPSMLIDEIELVEPLEIQQASVFLSDEVMDLQMVDSFLTAVERRYLQDAERAFDPSRIRAHLSFLENLSGELPTEKFNRIVNDIRSGITEWLGSLESRDSMIHAYHLRQFCDEPGREIKPVVYSALTRFYRELPPSPSAQSKFDLSITRLFSKSHEPPFREMLIEREDLVDQIAALFDGWDLYKPKKREPNHASLVAAKLDDFQREAQALADYQELFGSDLFDRLRAFKRKLGSLYSHPAVAAAAVECNISVGNAFNLVLTNANSKATERVSEGVDLAGAFYDASPGAEMVISEILSDLRLKSAEASDSGEDGSASVEDILALVCEGPENEWESEKDNEIAKRDESGQPTATPDPRPTIPTAQKRLEPFFFALSQPEPEISTIRKHTSRFGALADIDLQDFLGRPEDPNDHLCRNVLGVLMWIEELCENELNTRGEMSSSLRDELHRLLRRSEEFSEQLDYLIRENSASSQSRLLIVSNHLLESRLKLKRGIARFTRRNLEKAVVEEKPDLPEEPVAEKRTTPFALTVSGPTNRWLVAATLLVSLISGAIYFFDQQMSQFIPVAKDVELLDVGKLPQGEHLSQGFKKGGLIMITAKDSWTLLSEDEQRQNLEDLRKYPSKTEVSNVMVTDTSGRMLGDVSDEGTRILGKLQATGPEAKEEAPLQVPDPGTEGQDQ
ncbi:MAG: hypothetical protein J5I65_11625 [Aridibacter famidurans]|nr:hypothetical protein [Aridibacter famidurans]